MLRQIVLQPPHDERRRRGRRCKSRRPGARRRRARWPPPPQESGRQRRTRSAVVGMPAAASSSSTWIPEKVPGILTMTFSPQLAIFRALTQHRGAVAGFLRLDLGTDVAAGLAARLVDAAQAASDVAHDDAKQFDDAVVALRGRRDGGHAVGVEICLDRQRFIGERRDSTCSRWRRWPTRRPCPSSGRNRCTIGSACSSPSSSDIRTCSSIPLVAFRCPIPVVAACAGSALVQFAFGASARISAFARIAVQSSRAAREDRRSCQSCLESGFILSARRRTDRSRQPRRS